MTPAGENKSPEIWKQLSCHPEKYSEGICAARGEHIRPGTRGRRTAQLPTTLGEFAPAVGLTNFVIS
jgi:hypothetical protein